jgi:hypothetical protein
VCGLTEPKADWLAILRGREEFKMRQSFFKFGINLLVRTSLLSLLHFYSLMCTNFRIALQSSLLLTPLGFKKLRRFYLSRKSKDNQSNVR